MRNVDTTLESVEELAEKAGIKEATFYVAYNKKGSLAKATIFAANESASALLGVIPQGRYLRHAGLRVVAEDEDKKAVERAHQAWLAVDEVRHQARNVWLEANKASAKAENEMLALVPALQDACDKAQAVLAEAQEVVAAADKVLMAAQAADLRHRAEIENVPRWGARRCRVVGLPAGPPIVVLGTKKPKLRHHA